MIFTIQLCFSNMLIHCFKLILTSLLSRSSSNMWSTERDMSTWMDHPNDHKTNSRNDMLKHLELRHQTHREGWKNKRHGLIWWATIPRLERWWMVPRWRGNNFHGPVTGHLEKGESLNCSLKWQKELLLIHRSLKLFIPS